MTFQHLVTGELLGKKSHILLFVVHLDSVTPKVPELIIKKQEARSVKNRVLFIDKIVLSNILISRLVSLCFSLNFPSEFDVAC